ncbi:hypothetical protein Tco_0175096, partial [Tanacetum coccineum]
MKSLSKFVDIDTKLVEGSETREEENSKRAGDELEQENAKKQKVDDDQEIAELQSMMKIVPSEEEVAVDVIPLATKPPSIIEYKIIKEGKIRKTIKFNKLWKFKRKMQCRRHNDDLMFDTGVFNDEEVFAGKDIAEKEVSTADPITIAGEVVNTANVEVSTASPTAATITNVELTLAQKLA